MIISTQKLVLLLPVIFVLHNIEEYLYYDKFTNYYPKFVDQKFNDQKVFLVAVSILSVAVALIAGLDYCFSNNIIKHLTVIVLFSVFINAIQHCICSLFFRKILPGTITSVLLIIPYAIIFITTAKLELNFGFKELISYGIASIFVMIISILISLKIGYWLIKP